MPICSRPASNRSARAPAGALHARDRLFGPIISAMAGSRGKERSHGREAEFPIRRVGNNMSDEKQEEEHNDIEQEDAGQPESGPEEGQEC